MEQEQGKDINTLEVRAVLKVHYVFQDRMVGQGIILISDKSFGDNQFRQPRGQVQSGKPNMVADHFNCNDQVILTDWSPPPHEFSQNFKVCGPEGIASLLHVTSSRSLSSEAGCLQTFMGLPRDVLISFVCYDKKSAR